MTTMRVLLLFVLLLTCAVAETITAVVGVKVNLTCKVLNNNNSVTDLDWIRPDLEPDQVLFYRNNKSDHHYQHPSFQNRVDLQDLQKGDVSLILRNLKINDSGTYECHVGQKETNRHKRDAGLINTIILVPSDAKTITAVVGENVTLTCKVPNNNPVMFVDWIRLDLKPDHVLFYRNNKFYHHYQNPSFQNRVDLQDLQKGDVSLILRNLKISDSGTYECHVGQKETNRHKRDADLINTINLSVDPSVVPSGEKHEKHEVKEEEEDRRSHSGTYWTVPLLVTAVLAAVVFLILKRRKKNSSSHPDEPADAEMNPLNYS